MGCSASPATVMHPRPTGRSARSQRSTMRERLIAAGGVALIAASMCAQKPDTLARASACRFSGVSCLTSCSRCTTHMSQPWEQLHIIKALGSTTCRNLGQPKTCRLRRLWFALQQMQQHMSQPWTPQNKVTPVRGKQVRGVLEACSFVHVFLVSNGVCILIVMELTVKCLYAVRVTAEGWG